MAEMMRKNEAVRKERLEREDREYQAAMRRVTKMLAMFLGGFAAMLTIICWAAGVTDGAVVTGALALGATTYGVL